ncbi:hypothetical protein BEL05_04935 [Shewanella colwelliana]|uniref:Uncharacterized protein n=1 Tax=Shewanella colwelliana TaxID=23 RepID=A0A1E5IP49_SHECO|nr:hypothetical protein [Shewanella colwelliana]OEG72324.1 hypothetical protein BEL05_04935 [Shewanella colwelliana]
MTVSTEQAQQTAQAEPKSLRAQFSALISGMAEIEKIPVFRPDLKAEQAQQLTQDGVNLTGQLIVTVEHQQARIEAIEARLDHIDQVADKLLAWLDGQEGWNHEES